MNFKYWTDTCHGLSRANGFWTYGREEILDAGPAELAENKDFFVAILISKVGLICSEAGELIEAIRKPPKTSEHVFELTAEEEEIADIVIRVLDYCGARQIDLERAIRLKHEFNSNRPYKHGKLA